MRIPAGLIAAAVTGQLDLPAADREPLPVAAEPQLDLFGGSVTVRVPVRPALLDWACRRVGHTPQDLALRFPRLPDWIAGTSSRP